MSDLNSEQQPAKRNIDERIDALTMNLELLTKDVQALTANIAEVTANSKRDAESIRALARIAEIHERRLTAIEGDNPA